MIDRIPASFVLTAHKWRVTFVRSISDGETFGDCDNIDHVIRISETVHGRTTTDAERLQTFIHEFYHALLQTVGRDDESLVLTLENLTYQATTTAKYKHDHSRTRSSSHNSNGRRATRTRKTADEATQGNESESGSTI